jgi:hypothetical protein
VPTIFFCTQRRQPCIVVGTAHPTSYRQRNLLNHHWLARMLNPPRHHVYFAVFDFGDDPSVVTRAMGIEPTNAWAKGEPIPGPGHGRRTHSRWVLQSALPLAEPIEAHFDNLLPQLECRREAVAEVRSRFDACLAVAAYCDEFNQEFQLTADVIQRVAALGLEVDFDLYFFGGAGDAT